MFGQHLALVSGSTVYSMDSLARRSTSTSSHSSDNSVFPTLTRPRLHPSLPDRPQSFTASPTSAISLNAPVYPALQSQPSSQAGPEDGQLEAQEDGQLDETLPPESHNDDNSDIASTPPSTPRITPITPKSVPTRKPPPKLSLPKRPPAPALPVYARENLPCMSEIRPACNSVLNDDFAVTHEQLWEAKILILDLLGWGVPPSYIVECGLTRQIIYTVFTELNLRLPENLDLTGLLKPLTSSEAMDIASDDR